MNLITREVLMAAGMPPARAGVFGPPLAVACKRFRIDTPTRAGAFLAQCSVESAGFTRLEDVLFHGSVASLRAQFPDAALSDEEAQAFLCRPAALANRMFAWEHGNRGEASGDGWTYRGRGLIRLAGRCNYIDAAAALDPEYLAHPDRVGQPVGACLTAAWFWHAAKLNWLADAGRHDEISWRLTGRRPDDAGRRRALSEQTAAAVARHLHVAEVSGAL